MTITEALAEIKLIDAKIEKKRLQIRTFLYRQEMMKDPLLKDGGSESFIAREYQAIADLEARKVALRIEIANTNSVTPVTVGGVTRSISEWLVWRREVLPTKKQFLQGLRTQLDSVRRDAQARGVRVGDPSGAVAPQDFIVNFDEAQLAREIEKLTDIEGTLDGQLSMKNATVQVGSYE